MNLYLDKAAVIIEGTKERMKERKYPRFLSSVYLFLLLKIEIESLNYFPAAQNCNFLFFVRL